jgi:transcriptional regulator with GAF, ATPase, and Fis domain
VLDYPWVSERHAIIGASDPPYVVDVGSRNSTIVDGHRLEPHRRHPLAAGSVISIGALSLLVTRSEEQTSTVLRRSLPGEGTSAVMRRAPAVEREAPPEEAPRSADGAPIVCDARMQKLYAFARQIGASSVSVLITGETGSGKELMAQAIHRSSPRSRRALVSLNCAAIPENLVESELFGYERGAFSGAVSAKRGLFEVAHGTTLFLDEIGELSTSVQAKLLRVLESGEVQRLGALRPTHVDVRIVAATNRDLTLQVRRGAFRADLFYRLNGSTIAIPPLRERPDEIAELARYFAIRSRVEPPVELAPEALAALRAHSWPGNVRELKAVVERAALVCTAGVVQASDLSIDGASIVLDEDAAAALGADPPEAERTERFSAEEVPTSAFREELERRERKRTREALDRTGGNQTEAARLLGVSRRTLMKRMDRFGMNRPRKKAERSDDE